jgi:hypothetical protein
MRMDRVKQSAVTELDGQIAEKQGEVDYLEGQTGSSLWLTDLEAFRQAWVSYSGARVADSVSVTKTDSKAPKKKPMMKK